MQDMPEGRKVAGIHLIEGGEGPAVLMLHGSGPGVSGWSNFSGNFPVLTRHHRVLVPDMPGFGSSPLPELDRVYPEVAADKLADMLDELSIDQVDVVGNSMGGYVGIQLSRQHPERVRRLALMGPGGLAAALYSPPVSEGNRRLREFLADPTRERMVAWVDTMVANTAVVDDALIDQRTRSALVPGAIENTVRIFASLSDPALPEHVMPWQVAASLTHPMLIIWGRDDRMLPYEQSAFGFRHLPDAELHVFSGCGHWAQVERKDAFERLVLEFFSREEPSHPSGR